jgi:hypothetical protein
LDVKSYRQTDFEVSTTSREAWCGSRVAMAAQAPGNGTLVPVHGPPRRPPTPLADRNVLLEEMLSVKKEMKILGLELRGVSEDLSHRLGVVDGRLQAHSAQNHGPFSDEKPLDRVKDAPSHSSGLLVLLG